MTRQWLIPHLYSPICAACATARYYSPTSKASNGSKSYREHHVNRGAIWYFDAGSRVHELTSPDAKTYVMQAYCTGVDESLTEASLDGLGARLQLPLGWSYGSRVLDTELVVDNTERVATVIQDELENTYTLLD